MVCDITMYMHINFVHIRMCSYLYIFSYVRVYTATCTYVLVKHIRNYNCSYF